ncbi:peptide deformylase [Candidatus Microgenomates bacterium]|nr:peptide deformylase [Candidatus Microgenomates bacterium]
MVKKIVPSTDKKLRQISKPVGSVDKKIKTIITDLKDTLKAQKEPAGVGLAAPQIGKNIRMFWVDFEGFSRLVINPQIIKVEKTKTKKKTIKAHDHEHEILEGCLSLPSYYGPLKRANRVTLKYLSEKGEDMIEIFEDFHAQIILHEVDHLDGILFVDKLIEQKKKLYRIDKNEEWEEVTIV